MIGPIGLMRFLVETYDNIRSADPGFTGFLTASIIVILCFCTVMAFWSFGLFLIAVLIFEVGCWIGWIGAFFVLKTYPISSG